MNFNEYRNLSIRTLDSISNIYELEEDQSWSSNLRQALIASDYSHMALGMVSELEELYDAIRKEDDVNIGEELADIVWYVSGLLYLLDKHEEHFPKVEFNFRPEKGDTKIIESFYFRKLTVNISKVSDHVKKHLAYRKDMNLSILAANLLNVLECVGYVANYYGLDMDEQMDKNIRKLKIRFPDKFTTEKANSRNLKNERKELES